MAIGIMLNSSALLVVATIGIAVLSVTGLTIAIIQSNMSKKTALLLANIVVERNLCIDNLKMPISGFNILNRMIKDKSLPIEIILTHTTKRLVTIGLRSCNSENKEEASEIEVEKIKVIRDNLRLSIRLIDTMTVAIVGSILMVVVSFMAILMPKSIWDLVAAAVAPFAFIIMMGVFLWLARRKKRG